MVVKTNIFSKDEFEKLFSLSNDEVVHSIRSYAKHLQSKRVIMINSTPEGGGVAELLKNLVPLFNEIGIQTEWHTLSAPQEFFDHTKVFHNALQGDKSLDIAPHITYYNNFFKSEVRKYNPKLFERLDNLDSNDIVVVHDPQPLALINHRNAEDGSHWICRIHPDLTDPHTKLWAFLSDMMSRYEKIIVSRDSFVHGNRKNTIIIPPSINPLADKNKELSSKQIHSLLEQYNVPTEMPLITQVSRLDKWKDPLGVIDAFSLFKNNNPSAPARLLLVYNSAVDDPEGAVMKEKVTSAVNSSPFKKDIQLVVGDHPLLVNALQTHSRVVLQKSLREGFGLTVTEAMWKQTPVIGTNTGGISLQLKHESTGYLVDPYPTDEDANPLDENDVKRHIEQTAKYIERCLTDREHSKKLGISAKEYVRKHFLITRHLNDYLKLFESILR
ncbi:MAG: glycosyltransferase [Nanobdellota archaeon]